LKVATANDIWNTTKGIPVTRIGRIFEDAALRSLEMKKNTKTFRPSPTGRGVIPDAVRKSHAVVDELRNGSPFPIRRRISFNNATFIDAKFSSNISLEPNNRSADQIKAMIDYLSNVKGATIDGYYNPNIKASDFGAAKLVFITPANTTIGSPDELTSLIEYATAKRVQLFQRFMEVDEENNERVRVGDGIPLNIIPKMDISNIIGGDSTFEIPTEATTIIDKRPSVELNFDKK
jgi:hypothetical protein